MITVKTRLAGILGNPLLQTASPSMHNAAYESMGLDALYLPVEVPEERLESALKSMELFRFMGCNVTIPFKSAVIPYLDEIDDFALACGAVNTISFFDGRRKGFNTDGPGFVRSLKEKGGFDPNGKRVFVAGAGGAARGIVSALAESGAERITVLNRTEEKAVRLADDVNKRWPGKVIGGALSEDTVHRALATADLVVNSTKMGMVPKEDETPFDTSFLTPNQFVSDLIYNPRATKLLREAEKMGCRTLGGLWMLIFQGAEAIRIWTGQEPPVDVMAEACEHFFSRSKVSNDKAYYIKEGDQR